MIKNSLKTESVSTSNKKEAKFWQGIAIKPGATTPKARQAPIERQRRVS
jgi:hypothetical protein